MPSFHLPRQALQGLYAAVNPRIRFLSRQWMQKGSDMICCPCRYSTDRALPFLSTWLARWCARLCRFACKELEHEGFDAAALLQSEGFCVQPAQKELVEVLAMASGIAERRIIAVSSRNTVFSAMKDFGCRGQFWNRSQDCVRAACAKCGMQRDMGHQMARNVLHAVTATEVDACQWTCNLAVLIAEWRTSETQYFVQDIRRNYDL